MSLVNNQYVTVSAPGRLHLGFVDVGGSLGRKFISVGMAIDTIKTVLSIAPSDVFSASGVVSERAQRLAKQLYEAWDLPGACHIEVHQAIPEHSGLGSGTQLALAVGAGVARLVDRQVSVPEIAMALGRGLRSGIGIAAFEQGGFIVDGGRGKLGLPPPTVSRIPFPETWKVLLISDHEYSGLHGQNERDAFMTLPKFSDDCAAFLSRQVLARVLPGLIEKDLNGFSLGIRELQQKIGDYFAPAQGGRYTSKLVASVLEFIRSNDVVGIGQSSWGPTGFAFFEDVGKAEEMVAKINREFAGDVHLALEIVSGSNVGADLQCNESNTLSSACPA